MDILKLKTFLDNQEVQAPEELLDIKLLATFDNDATQANIEAQTLTFTGAGRQAILNHVDQGYFFEGMPFRFQLQKGAQQFLAFDGMLNLNNEYAEFDTDRVQAKMQKLDGLNTLNERLSALTFDLLNVEGRLNTKNVEYLVEKRKSLLEIAIASLLIYSVVDQIASEIRKLLDDQSDVIAKSSSTPPNVIGASLVTAARIATRIAYYAAAVVAVYKIAKDLLETLISPVRRYKMVSYYDMMAASVEKLGYKFSSSIDYLHKAHYLASDPFDEELTGAPNPNDRDWETIL